MTKREAMRINHQEAALLGLGFTTKEAEALRRISMTLHRWHERECGTDGGCIERDDETGKPFWLNSHTMRRWTIPDRETGAKQRLDAIIEARNKREVERLRVKRLHDTATVPGFDPKRDGLLTPVALGYFIQTDPRGAALYIIRPGDVPEGQSVESYYTRGICVY